MSNIILIGMPGAGKSTVGVLLAKALGYFFIDTDLLIQQQEKSLLQNIINCKGLDYFIAIEESVILSLKSANSVIATGGSAVYSNKAMESLKLKGKIVYLEVNYAEIANRIKNITTRGIAAKEGYSLIDLYKERTPLYEKYADITIECMSKSAEELVNSIMDSVNGI